VPASDGLSAVGSASLKFSAVTATNVVAATAVLPNAASAANIGTAALSFARVFVDNTATDGGAIIFDADTTASLKAIAAGTQLQVGSKFTSVTPASASGAALGTTTLPWDSVVIGGDDSSAPAANTLYAANILKGWAHLDAGATGAVTVTNDHNIASASWTLSTLTVDFDTAMGNSTYVVVPNISNNASGDGDAFPAAEAFASTTFDLILYQNDGGGVEIWASGDDVELVVVGDMS
jgi:hypothetical protein